MLVKLLTAAQTCEIGPYSHPTSPVHMAKHLRPRAALSRPNAGPSTPATPVESASVSPDFRLQCSAAASKEKWRLNARVEFWLINSGSWSVKLDAGGLWMWSVKLDAAGLWMHLSWVWPREIGANCS